MKATGLDGLTASNLIRLCKDDAAVENMRKTFEEWFNGDISAYVKKTRIVMLAKKEPENDKVPVFPKVGEVRSIAIANNVGKLFEKVMLRKIEEDAGPDFFHHSQAGFRKGKSTLTLVQKLLSKLHRFSQTIRRELDTRPRIRRALRPIRGVAFIDFRRAFDSVNR